MYKLAGLDAAFLYNETPRAPQHIASIQVLELPEGTNLTDFIAALEQLLVERAHLVPYFTNKLQLMPFQLDHPVWVRDGAFHIGNHVLHAEVEAPGGRRELEAKIAELHSRAMDRSKPLWELWVLSGLEGGRIAYYNRVHHACLDGVSGQAALEAIMDVTSEPRAVEPPLPSFHHRPVHRSAVAMFTDAFENFTRYQLRQATRILDHADTARRLWQRAIDPEKGFGAAAEGAPRTRFNGSVERERSYATAELPMGDLRSIGKATGTTLNDVFLSVCAGALRSYLQRAGELPDQSLIAGCPVSLRQPGDTTANNQVNMMLVNVATNEADPVKRLLKISRSSKQAKGLLADIAASYDPDVALPWLPGIMTGMVRMLEAGNVANVMPPRLPCNLVVSNVPGPRQQLYSLGARVLTHYPVSIPAHSQAVNVTAQSYLDQMFVGITACARALPDPHVLCNDMLAAFGELSERVLKAPAVLKTRERSPEEGRPPLGSPPADTVAAPRAA